jgi:Fe-S-cluster containining protein
VPLTREKALIQIVDAASEEAARRGGDWIVCRAGCHECCVGVFPIAQADVLRLQEGLRTLRATDPQRANRVLERARAAIEAYADTFPGDLATGILASDPDSAARFEELGNDNPCPALDPETGMCDLYTWRPVTCRTFGPALRINSDSVDTCELCFHGATDDEIVSCVVDLEIAEKAAALEEEAKAATGLSGETIVAFALR